MPNVAKLPGRDSQALPLVSVEVTSTSLALTLDTEWVGETDPTPEQLLSTRLLNFAAFATCGDDGPRSKDVEFPLPSTPSFRDPDTYTIRDSGT